MRPAQWFSLNSTREKVQHLPAVLSTALGATSRELSTRREFELGRDAQIVAPAELPKKPGLGRLEGQARLLHDLASIELQAMELGVRTLADYPEAPKEFREELSEITLGEARHLTLCLDRLESMGFAWGHWPVHVSLWNTVASEDTLVDRIMIVHRYLEGAGLDSGESILRRLTGAGTSLGARDVVETIVKEEIDHVAFGSRWYNRVAKAAGLDPERDFCARLAHVARLAPRRDRIARELRFKAGFTEAEIVALEQTVGQYYKSN